MVSSRLNRVEEKKARKRIVYSIIGMLAVLFFLGIFGLRLLIWFSLLVEKLRGGSTQPQQQQQSILMPPVLSQLPDATNSATLTVNGTATAKGQVVLYLNNSEYKRMTVGADGTFSFSDIPVDETTYTVSAKLTDGKSAFSDPSNVISTIIDRTPPKLTVDTPDDNATINDGTRHVTVSGKTDPDAHVTITGRVVVVRSDGSYSYSMPLNDGANKLEVIASDEAGNTTTIDRNVTYQP